jgi:molybdopterin-guanine dinucleotide biosynthesis protein A
VWVVACDLPLLTSTCLAQLTEGREEHLARLFESSGRLQPLVGLWRRDAYPYLAELELRGAPLQSLKGAPWMKVCKAQEQAALFNLNTLHDLEQLADLL